ncbi:MAG TPA: hypothetical protein VGA50_20705, partial [Kiloniellales bacterium]
MTSVRFKAVCVLSAVALVGATGCAEIERETGLGTGAQTGAAVGGAAGGLIASAAGAGTGWIIASAVLGAIAGGVVGDYLTTRDKELAGQTTTTALETQPAGTQSTWQNPDSGN